MHNQLKYNGIPSGRTNSDVVAGYDVPITALGLPFSFSTMEKQSTIENLEGEIWKPIAGYEGLYEVSNLGRVKSIERYTEYKNCKSTHRIGIKSKVNGRVVKGLICCGYHYVGLAKEGVRKNYRVHRLVAMTFIPNPNNLPIINHKDENRLNNSVDNLEWCTQKYNANYGNARKKLSESLTKNRGVKVVQKNREGQVIAEYKSIIEASRATGIPDENINKVVHKKYDKQRNGKYYKRTTAGGYIWELA